MTAHMSCFFSCIVPAGASHEAGSKTQATVPGRNPPQQTGPEASLQPDGLPCQNS